METYDTEGLITIQVAQLEKEKKEISERLRIISKRIDHTERAYRKEEHSLLAEDYQNQQMTDRETFEGIQRARRELSRQTHQDDLETKARLTRLLDDYHARKEVIIAKKQEEFAAKKAVAEKKIKEEKEKRLKAVMKAREEERARKEKEEKIRLQKVAEEARIEAGLCFSISFLGNISDVELDINQNVWQRKNVREKKRQQL